VCGVCTIVLLGLALAGSAPAQAQTDTHTDEKRAARAAASEWLTMIEERDFEESWEDAAVLFRDRIDRSAWTESGTRMADSVGTPRARTLTDTRYLDSIRRVAAEGPFVALRYRSTFASGRFEELLLLAREDDEWKVAGYRVRPLQPSAPPILSAPVDGPQP
jgi:hypothetical protein